MSNPPRPPRTIILAPTYAIAVHRARQEGIPPRGRGVVLASTPDRLRGLQIHPYDRVIWEDPLRHPWPRYLELDEAVTLCRLAGGSA